MSSASASLVCQNDPCQNSGNCSVQRHDAYCTCLPGGFVNSGLVDLHYPLLCVQLVVILIWKHAQLNNNDNNKSNHKNSGCFYSTVSCQQGWAHHALQDRQNRKCLNLKDNDCIIVLLYSLRTTPTHMHTHTHACMHTQTHARTCTHAHTRSHTHTHTHIHTPLSTHTRTCMHKRMHTHTHTHAHTLQPPHSPPHTHHQARDAMTQLTSAAGFNDLFGLDNHSAAQICRHDVSDPLDWLKHSAHCEIASPTSALFCA